MPLSNEVKEKLPPDNVGGDAYNTRATKDGYVVLNIQTNAPRLTDAFKEFPWANDPQWDDVANASSGSMTPGADRGPQDAHH